MNDLLNSILKYFQAGTSVVKAQPEPLTPDMTHLIRLLFGNTVDPSKMTVGDPKGGLNKLGYAGLYNNYQDLLPNLPTMYVERIDRFNPSGSGAPMRKKWTEQVVAHEAGHHWYYDRYDLPRGEANYDFLKSGPTFMDALKAGKSEHVSMWIEMAARAEQDPNKRIVVDGVDVTDEAKKVKYYLRGAGDFEVPPHDVLEDLGVRPEDWRDRYAPKK